MGGVCGSGAPPREETKVSIILVFWSLGRVWDTFWIALGRSSVCPRSSRRIPNEVVICMLGLSIGFCVLGTNPWKLLSTFDCDT